MFYRKIDSKIDANKPVAFTARLNSMIKSKNQEFFDEIDKNKVIKGMK